MNLPSPPPEYQKRFSETHDLSRWNLQDTTDAYKLWYTLTMLEARLFELYFLQYRRKEYSKSHTTFGEYWGMKAARNILFPYTDSKLTWEAMWMNQIEKKIQELEKES